MDNQPDLTSKGGETYKWLVLISFCLNSITNVFLFTAISPIWSLVALYYNTTDYNLNWFTNVYQLGPMTTAFLFNFLILKYYGISQISSCLLTCIGLWLLVFVKQNYYFALLAFIFIGVGESLFYQVPLCICSIIVDLSKIWFESEERVMSTFISQYSSNIGMFIGYTGSAYYFNGINDLEQFKPLYENMIRLNAIVSIINVILSLVTIKQPDKQNEKIENREAIGKSLYKICTTSDSVFDLLSVGSFIGVSWTYPTLFGTQQYIIGQNYLDVTQASISFQLGQILAGFACTWQLQKQSKKGLQQNYDKYIKYTMGIGFWFLVMEILLFENLPVSLLIIINFFVGAGLGGLYSVLLESLMEKHFPVHELAIGTILAAVISAESFVVTMILVIPQFLKYGFQISAFFMIPSYCYIQGFYQTQFKRFEFEV